MFPSYLDKFYNIQVEYNQLKTQLKRMSKELKRNTVMKAILNYNNPEKATVKKIDLNSTLKEGRKRSFIINPKNLTQKKPPKFHNGPFSLFDRKVADNTHKACKVQYENSWTPKTTFYPISRQTQRRPCSKLERNSLFTPMSMYSPPSEFIRSLEAKINPSERVPESLNKSITIVEKLLGNDSGRLPSRETHL